MLQKYRSRSAQNTVKCLKNSERLNGFYQRLQQEEQIKDIIVTASGLNDTLFHIASSEGDLLVLHSQNATAATQLRMTSTTILRDISAVFLWKYKFQNIKVHVRPMYTKQRSKQPVLRRISGETAELLKDAAMHSENPKLKEVLLRISKHQK